MAALYTPRILDHHANPRNYGTLDTFDYSHEAENSLCGDRIRIDVRLDGDIISQIRFSGAGCAISQAAASMLTELVAGNNIARIKAFESDDLLSELAVPLTSSRLQCALLGLQVLQMSIANH